MRKLLCVVLALCCIIAFPGCSEEEPISGIALAHDQENNLILVAAESSNHSYAFLIDKDTQFIWQDSQMEACHSRYESGQLEYFWLNCAVEVIPGQEIHDADISYLKKYLFGSRIFSGTYHARKIIVTQVYDEYTEYTEAA